MTSILELGFFIFVVGILLGWVIMNLTWLCQNVLQPLYFFFDRIGQAVLKPFRKLWGCCESRINRFKNRVFKPRPDLLPRFGGLSTVIWIGFCLLFSTATLLFIAFSSNEGGKAVHENLLMSFPVFSILSMLFPSEFPPCSLLEIALFGVLSSLFMKKVVDLHKHLRLAYSLVFTTFCTCLLFWIPNEWFGNLYNYIMALPLAVVEGATVSSFMGIVHIILLAIFMAIVLYVSVISSVLSLKELFSSLAFSLIPFLIACFVSFIVQKLNLPGFISVTCTYLLLLGITVWMQSTEERATANSERNYADKQRRKAYKRQEKQRRKEQKRLQKQYRR